MPRIKPYQTQTTTAQNVSMPQASMDAAGAVGRGIQQVGQAVGEVEDAIKKRDEQAELSQLHADIATKQAQWSIEYNKQLQQGTLNTEDFNQKFGEDIDKIQEKVATRAGTNYFRQASSQLKAHFLETAAVGQAQLAGAKAKDNYVQGLNAGSSVLVNDPSSFALTHKMQMEGIDNLVRSGGLPALKADELRRSSTNSLAKSAVKGWINLNPEAAKQQINSGAWDKYLGDDNTDAGTVKLQLLGEIDQAQRAKEIEANRLKAQQKEAIEQQQLSIQNDFLAKMSEGKLSTKDVLNSQLEAFGSGSKEQFLRLIEQNEEAKTKPIKTDSGTYINLWDRIHLPEGDPNKIVNENDLNKFMGRGLTLTDINALRAEMQGKKTVAGADESELKNNFLNNIIKGKLTKSNPLTGLRDPEGDANYQKFLSTFLPEYNKKRQEGKTSQELLTPGSPDYLGNNAEQYIRSAKQITADMVKSMKRTNVITAPTPAPRMEGESANDYLKRLGK